MYKYFLLKYLTQLLITSTMEKSAMSGYLVWLYFVHSDACMLLVIESVYILDKHNSLITINCYLGQIMTSLDGNFS